MEELYELKEKLCKELKKYNEKDGITKAEEVEMIDTLAHAVKNIDKIIMSYEYEDGHSSRSSNSYRFYNVRPQGNYDRDGHSYARDDRGRYSTHNEHRPDDLMDEFQRLMDRYR